jgi:putative transposase
LASKKSEKLNDLIDFPFFIREIKMTSDKSRSLWLRHIWADCGYMGKELFNWVLSEFNCTLEIVKRQKRKKGFHVLPRRWVVERTFAWLGRSRRLSKDYEREPRSSESQVYLASSRLLLRQICNNQIAYE